MTAAAGWARDGRQIVVSIGRPTEWPRRYPGSTPALAWPHTIPGVYTATLRGIPLQDLVGARLGYDVGDHYPKRPTGTVVMTSAQGVVNGYRRCLEDARRAGDDAAQRRWRRSLRQAHSLLRALRAGNAVNSLGWSVGLGPVALGEREEDQRTRADTLRHVRAVHPLPVLPSPDVDPRLVPFGHLAPPTRRLFLTRGWRAA